MTVSVSYPAGHYTIEAFSDGEARLWHWPPERQDVTLPPSLRASLVALALRNPGADGRPRDHGAWVLDWSDSQRVRDAVGGLGYDERAELLIQAARAHGAGPEDLAAVMGKLAELRSRSPGGVP